MRTKLGPAPDSSALATRFAQVRGLSEALVGPLSDADATIQSMDDASPAKWHLAHTTWFFETFVLRDHVPGYRHFDDRFAFLFNSYYEAEGERHARPRRGMLTRPTLDEVLAYRAAVDAALLDALPDLPDEARTLIELGCHHEEQHQELVEFVDEMEFDRLGVFTYSPEENTPAAEMPDQISEEVKEDRQAELMELQQEIAFDLAEDMIDREVLVMIEGKVADENAYVGRTYQDAPNVDGLIFINTDEELMSGDFAKVKITGAMEYDLIGELM